MNYRNIIEAITLIRCISQLNIFIRRITPMYKRRSI